MDQITIPLFVGIIALGAGSVLGYYARQSIAKKQAGTIEQKLQKRISDTKAEAETILTQAKEKASKIIYSAQREESTRRQELLETERLLLKRENILDEKSSVFEGKEKDFQLKVAKLREVKENIENLKLEAEKKLENVSKLSREEAKNELLAMVERDSQKEMMEKMRYLESEGAEKYEQKAKEILAQAIQKYAISQAQEITTTTVSLPSEEIKGRIIGKEGRNIRTLERLTGVEIVIDETPEAVVISAFDPVRRQIAKMALEKLIHDGRIQPARIEEMVQKSETEIVGQMKSAGEAAVYDTGVLGLDPKVIQLLGRLRFRTSYGQNVLLHSIEVCHLAGAIAAEIGANVSIAKKAGLLHDIGKAVDQQVEGSHTDIGVKILEKFGADKDVISAVRSHHEEHPYESVEGVIIQAADAISGARPGARKDTLENYLKRLGDLEKIALDFHGVEKAWALQAGREIRVFVKPDEVDDFEAKKIARGIANKIQEELRYPGEIKVTLIRENRIVEFAK